MIRQPLYSGMPGSLLTVRVILHFSAGFYKLSIQSPAVNRKDGPGRHHNSQGSRRVLTGH